MKYNPKTTAILEIIPVVLICTAGIILATRMHLYLALLLHRDYFGRSDSSLSSSFVPQGLLCPSRIHLYLPLLSHRDYFHQPDASLSCSFVPQGLFCPGWMHLYLDLLFHRDYFHRSNASPACSFAPQGLFPPARFISILLFCSTGIISAVQMHLYLALLSRLLDFLLFLSRRHAQTSIAPMIP